MNETPTPRPKAMEGRAHDAEGKDIGDAHFHAVGWNTTVEAAHADLERIAAAEVELAERQVETFAMHDATIGAAGFESLIRLYPNHPNITRWKQRADELRHTP